MFQLLLCTVCNRLTLSLISLRARNLMLPRMSESGVTVDKWVGWGSWEVSNQTLYWAENRITVHAFATCSIRVTQLDFDISRCAVYSMSGRAVIMLGGISLRIDANWRRRRYPIWQTVLLIYLALHCTVCCKCALIYSGSLGPAEGHSQPQHLTQYWGVLCQVSVHAYTSIWPILHYNITCVCSLFQQVHFPMWYSMHCNTQQLQSEIHRLSVGVSCTTEVYEIILRSMQIPFMFA